MIVRIPTSGAKSSGPAQDSQASDPKGPPGTWAVLFMQATILEWNPRRIPAGPYSDGSYPIDCAAIQAGSLAIPHYRRIAPGGVIAAKEPFT